MKEESTLEDKEKGKKILKTGATCPGCVATCHGHAKHVSESIDMRRVQFRASSEKKVQIFSINSYGNMHINTRAFIHKFSFRMSRLKRKAWARKIKGGVSPQHLFLEYVLFPL
jgi:aldehyde:ferredoxin oxidoreductase